MTSVVTTGSFSRALYPAINAWYGERYKEWAPEWSEIFEEVEAKYREEQDVLFSGYGLVPVKAEGEPISYDSSEQGFVQRYIQDTYGLGFAVTREMIEDELYGLMRKRARALAFSIRQTREITGAYVLNQAFNSAVTYGDGIQLISTGHLNQGGGTFANRASADADLSETSLEELLILIDDFRDDRGLRIALQGQKLVIPTALRYEAERILESTLQNDSAENAINALKATGVLPMGYVVNHYLTDTDAWFVLTDAEDGLKCFVKRPDTFEEDNDFNTENLLYKVSGRWIFGATDPRAIVGSAGA